MYVKSQDITNCLHGQSKLQVQTLMLTPRFLLGQIIHHRLFDYRGVIFDVNENFQGSDAWYEQMASSGPPKDKPWYRVLVHDLGYETYVAERNLELDKSGDPSARVGRLPGGPTVRALDFKNRIKNETLRYFTKENPDFGTSGFSVDAGLMTALAKTDISDYTYLAPSVIQPTARTPISLFDDLPSAPRLCAAVSDILNIKSPPNEPKRIPTPAAAGRRQPDEERSTVYAQVVRDNLTDVLADRGCTVELPMRAVRRPEFTVAGVRNNEVAELRGLPSIGGVLTPEDIREAAGASDTGISNYLGETPAVINQFEPETEDTVRANTQSNGDILNAGLLFLRIMYNTILENEDLVRSRRTLTLRETRDRLSINNFNLRNPDNAIERAARVRSLGPRADARGRLRPRVGGSYSFVPQLPNQIKSLFLASNPSGQTVVNDRTIFDNSNVLADPVHAIIIFLKYLNLSKIEVMTGFETTSVAVHSPVITSGASNQIGGTPNVRQKTETQLKSPTWELLTRENFQQFVGQRKEMVCRLTPYRNGIMKIKALAGIQLPVYDSYFIIRPDNPSEVRSPSLRIDTDGSSIRELVNLENVMRTIRTEYISTDPRRSIVGLSGPIDVGTTLSAPRPSIEEEPVRGQGEGRYS